MKRKKHIFISSLVTVVAAGAIGVGVANACHGGNLRREDLVSVVGHKNKRVDENFTITDHHEVPPMTDRDIAAITAAHHLRRAGDHVGAQAVLEQSGIEAHMPEKGFKGQITTVKGALARGSWDQFQQAAYGTKLAREIDTEEKFAVLAESYALHKQGRHAEARGVMRQMHRL